VKDKKSVFYCSLLFVIVNIVLFINLQVDATSSQQPSVVSDLNVNSTTPDIIDKTVKGMATKNIDKLMTETILPALANSSTTTFVGGSNNNSAPLMADPTQELGTANNARAVADNGTILLQFQNPTDIDIVNRLEKIETTIQKYMMRNDANSTAKSIEESNNRIINELSEIKSSISESSVLPAATAKSIEESNNRIINELSEIKSSISESSSSSFFSGIIRGALVAAIVSAVAFFVLLRVYGSSGIKLSELKLRRRNNSNYT
jgi:hypothetical protein